jgi:F-type H+-transporting ATPase subunit gamma
MPTVKQIQDEISGVETIRTISSALLEISAAKIQRIRKDFEQNQNFFDEISELYNIVKVSARKLNLAMPTKNIVDPKSVSVAITSNKGFYGLLNVKVIDEFLEQISDKDKNSHSIVVGNMGKRYLERTDQYGRCEYITFKDDYPTPGETDFLLKKVKSYDRVTLLYPKFVSVFTQEVGSVDITHTPDIKVDIKKEFEYIYEPELPQILDFFEVQVRHLLFMRIMLESDLARLAARLVKMSTTEERADDMITIKERELRKEIAVLNDIKLLESFSSIKQWRTEHNIK